MVAVHPAQLQNVADRKLYRVADYYRSNATPEGAISGSPSDFATANISGTGAAFLKVTGTGSTTGWEQLLTKSSGQQNLVMTRRYRLR